MWINSLSSGVKESEKKLWPNLSIYAKPHQKLLESIRDQDPSSIQISLKSVK